MIHFPPAASGQTELFGEPDRLTLLSLAAHIIVIDDEDVNVRLLKRMLEQAGFQSITALTQARNLPPLLASAPPDLVITDLHMPGIDGFGVLEMLAPQINEDRLPVLVVTGDGSRDARQRALTCGANDFVTEPFDLVEVLLRVRNLLESRLLFQDLRKQNRTLIETASGRTRELEVTRVEMIERLALAAEYRDEQTSDHLDRRAHSRRQPYARAATRGDDCAVAPRAVERRRLSAWTLGSGNPHGRQDRRGGRCVRCDDERSPLPSRAIH